jgi:hypothetical protein
MGVAAPVTVTKGGAPGGVSDDEPAPALRIATIGRLHRKLQAFTDDLWLN